MPLLNDCMVTALRHTVALSIYIIPYFLSISQVITGTRKRVFCDLRSPKTLRGILSVNSNQNWSTGPIIDMQYNKKIPMKIDFIRIFLRFLLLHSLFCGPDQFLQPFVTFSDGNIGADHLFTVFHNLYCFPEMLLSNLEKRFLCDHPGS